MQYNKMNIVPLPAKLSIQVTNGTKIHSKISKSTNQIKIRLGISIYTKSVTEIIRSNEKSDKMMMSSLSIPITYTVRKNKLPVTNSNTMYKLEILLLQFVQRPFVYKMK